MKLIRIAIFFGGLLTLVLATGYIFQISLITALWPWPDGRLSYLFVGSILAAVSVAMLWIGWTGELGALPAGSLNLLVIAATASVYLFYLSANGRPGLWLHASLGAVMALASAVAFVWSQRIALHDTRPMPGLVRLSFGVFTAALLLAGAALVGRIPIFPWALNPDSSVLFGCIFLGDACFFLHGLLKPAWHNALGQLLSFLAYDLVLIVPFLLLFPTVRPESLLSLVIYVAVLVYSGALAVYYVFIARETRLQKT